MRIAVLILILLTQQKAAAQEAVSDSLPDTSAYVLEEVTVHAYGLDIPLMQTPAAVGTVTAQALGRTADASILPAVNTLPGVRMEERSPSSYRFGIRGTAAQSPFGIRNIKAYYNDIPVTDAGGNTYLSQLGYYNIHSLEIIKGPGSSLYGAGTGGVLLINSLPATWSKHIAIHYTAGSYQMNNLAAELYTGDTAFKQVVRYQHTGSTGYRRQSESLKDIISWDGVIKTGNRNELNAHVLYSDINYQTPGGLTLTQYLQNPVQARPASGPIPGAVEQKAVIYQKSFLAGITNTWSVSPHWQNAATLFSTFIQQDNPNIRNYSRSTQPNYGGRTSFKYTGHINNNTTLNWITGTEIIKLEAKERTYMNNHGIPDTLTGDVEIDNTLTTAFTQLSVQTHRWLITAGVSLNNIQFTLRSFYNMYSTQSRHFNNQLAPRLAMLRQLSKFNTVYAAVEKGFTPPATSELAPTGSMVNTSLQPAGGWNYSLGNRGYFFNGRLYYDVNLFAFILTRAIVQRRDAAGGDYYINAGGTRQYGVELLINYKLLHNEHSFINDAAIGAAYTGYQFRYNDFRQLGNDYSGNKMPGIPGNTVNISFDINSRPGFYFNANYYYCSAMSLNDANTDNAGDYTLVSCKIGYKTALKKAGIDLFAGGDNLLNKQYSLGNDINAAGGRYYNAAPGINYYAGITVRYKY